MNHMVCELHLNKVVGGKGCVGRRSNNLSVAMATVGLRFRNGWCVTVCRCKTQKQLYRKGGLICKLGPSIWYLKNIQKSPGFEDEKSGLLLGLYLNLGSSYHILVAKFSILLRECELDHFFQLKNSNIPWLAVIIIRKINTWLHT